MADEETIKVLEEIDCKFSKINRILKSIDSKIKSLKLANKENISNITPWLNFFDLKTEQKVEAIEVDFDSSLAEFDIHSLPLIFQQDGEIQNVYNTVKRSRKIEIQKLIGMYEENEKDKILVFIDLLVKKRFIKHLNDFLYC